MRHSVIMGGFGGQGIMMMGRLLAHAATKAGLEAVWIPSYTPEMRHGVADCFVVVADSPIGELSLARVDTVIAMSDGALKRHGGSVRPGGLLILDRSIVKGEAGRDDVEVEELRASELADRLFGTPLVANMIVLGFFLGLTGVVDFEVALESVEEVLPPHRRSLAELNRRALEEGRTLAGSRLKLSEGG